MVAIMIIRLHEVFVLKIYMYNYELFKHIFNDNCYLLHYILINIFYEKVTGMWTIKSFYDFINSNLIINLNH